MMSFQEWVRFRQRYYAGKFGPLRLGQAFMNRPEFKSIPYDPTNEESVRQSTLFYSTNNTWCEEIILKHYVTYEEN